MRSSSVPLGEGSVVRTRARRRRRTTDLALRWLRSTVALLAGAATAVMDLAFLTGTGLVAALGLVWPAARARAALLVRVGALRLVALEHKRIGADVGAEPDDRAALRYLMIRAPIGLLAGYLALLGLFLGLAFVSLGTREWFVGSTEVLLQWPGLNLRTDSAVTATVVGLLMLYLTVQGTFAVTALERWLARRLLGPNPRQLLERRVVQLTASRAGVVGAVDDERRRIERDLHDGVQQRLVALAMLLGRARRSQNAPTELLRQAHEEAQQALADLRAVAWRVYPIALDDLGLRTALSGLAERSAVPVRLHYDIPDGPTGPAETAAYFVVSEAVTNAVKHASANLITVLITNKESAIVVDIRDDGGGGATLAGRGLRGLARRVAALDGTLSVDSPAGGPTTVRAQLPCG